MKAKKAYKNGGKLKGKKGVAKNDTLERSKDQAIRNYEDQMKEKDFGPGRSDYINQEKAAQGPLKKLKSKRPGNSLGIIPRAKTKSGTIKKGKAVIPVPPTKKEARKARRKKRN